MAKPGGHSKAIMALWEELPGRQSLHVLDAGAGKGLSTRLLMALGLRVTATIYAPARPEDMPPEAGLVAGVDLNRTWPFADGSFDGVNLKDVFEHLENPAHVVRECARVLRPGGWLVLSTPNILNAGSRLRFFATGYFQGWKRPMSYAKTLGNADNIYMTNLHQIHYLLAQCGLSVERLGADPWEWQALVPAVLGYPLFWLGAYGAARRVRRKSLLFRRERSKVPAVVQAELAVKQRALQRRLRRLLVSREALLSRNLILRARKTGGSPLDA